MHFLIKDYVVQFRWLTLNPFLFHIGPLHHQLLCHAFYMANMNSFDFALRNTLHQFYPYAIMETQEQSKFNMCTNAYKIILMSSWKPRNKVNSTCVQMHRKNKAYWVQKRMSHLHYFSKFPLQALLCKNHERPLEAL